MAWAILFTVTLLHVAHLGLGLLNLFKNSPEPTGPFRRPNRNRETELVMRHLAERVGHHIGSPRRVLKKVNWKEEGF